MNKKTILLVILATTLIGAVAFKTLYNGKSVLPERTGKPAVIVSFYPLGYIAEEVGGARVAVRTVIPSGAEPHDYEPTPLDIQKAHLADLFIFNGAGFDRWADQLSKDLVASNVRVVNMAEELRLSRQPEGGFEEENSGVGAADPHFWLDPVLMQRAAEVVRDAFTAQDHDGREEYQKHAEDFIARMQTLDDVFREGLSSCQLHEIIVSHDAFGYLADRYRFTIIPISGVSPEAEPSPKRLVELTQLARQRKIDYIFFETLVSPAVSQTLAREIGAKTLVLNPVEGLGEKEKSEGESYISIMEQNLQNLRLALRCP